MAGPAGGADLALTGLNHEGWHKRWDEGRIGWHKTVVDPALEVVAVVFVACVFVCNMGPGSFQQRRVGLLEEKRGPLSILVTMCGKTLDLLWLCSRGHSVTGAELSSVAVDQFFKENSVPYTITGTYGYILCLYVLK